MEFFHYTNFERRMPLPVDVDQVRWISRPLVMELVILDGRVLLRNLNSRESDLRQSQGCT